MKGYYLIVQKSDNSLAAIEESKNAANQYSDSVYHKWHWVEDICGTLPLIGSVFSDSRTYDIKRLCGYIMESDPMYMKRIGQLKDNALDLTADALWTTPRNAIKSKYPQP